MTAPRHRIAQSLAARGRPAMWATDAEAAILSGMSIDTFKDELPDLERRGFPRKNGINGKRSIPAILDFWGLQPEASAVIPISAEIQDEQAVENWG